MIDYSKIADSIDHYEALGYTRIETPWMVPECIDNLTKPKEKRHFQLQHNKKCLVASGEQSFLYLYMKGFLPKGKFQTVTPCFRDEYVDEIHGKYFIKNELIITDEITSNNLYNIIKDAGDFFGKYIDSKFLFIEETETGVDINYHKDDVKIELGSYGIRKCNFLKWIYGTGCAEPRLSNVLNIISNGKLQNE